MRLNVPNGNETEWKATDSMNRKRFLALMIAIATSGMMGACSTAEPVAESTATDDRLMAGWIDAEPESRQIICDAHITDPDYATETLAEFADITLVEASEFLYTVC